MEYCLSLLYVAMDELGLIWCMDAFMERRYKEVCKRHGCDAKVFCKFKGGMKDRIGSPDLMILFTHTVSHKMVQYALNETADNTRVVRSHTSSISSLDQILAEHAG